MPKKDDKLAELHFFDGKDAGKKNYEHDQVVMASYPRSGNTLLRGYLEKLWVSAQDLTVISQRVSTLLS
jgi:hypothetical protein